MSSDPESTIRRELRKGEFLVWYGRPRQGFYLRSSDALSIPFSVLWGGFAFFWEYGVVTSNSPILMILWGIPFVLIGIYLMIGRFFVDAWLRRNTTYGLTRERVIIVGGLVSLSVRSHWLRSLPNAQLIEHADGSGTIEISVENMAAKRWGRMRHDAWYGSVLSQLERIPDARSVFDSIVDLQRD